MEIDAYTFATLASATGINAATPADVSSSIDIAEELDIADEVMSDDEVPQEGRIAFVSEAAYANMKSKITRYVANSDVDINRTVEYYGGVRIIRVPQNRFYTGITMYDGTTAGQTDGGYIIPSGVYKINFMVVHPSAVVKVMKHVIPRVFSPEVNQSADAWLFQYRAYYDAFVLDNKVKGIYLHRGSTATVSA